MNKMKELRTNHGYTQQQFADLLDVSLPTVKKWESGERTPDRRSKKSLYNSLSKVDVDALFAEDDLQEILDRR